MVREDGAVVFYYARYADDMVFGLPRGDKSTRVTQGLKKVLARVLRELLQGFTLYHAYIIKKEYGAGSGNRTRNPKVMSLMSYQTALYS